MQDSKWLDKIINWKWTVTDSQSGNGGLSYSQDESDETVYLHEMNRTSKTVAVGKWNTIENKIGLIHVSDFLIPNTYMKNAISNNLLLRSIYTINGLYPLNYNGGPGVSSNYATISFSTMPSNEYIYTLYIDMGITAEMLHLSNNGNTYNISVHPTFYLASDVVLTGAGTLDNPYMIKE